MVRDAARDYAQERLAPRILEAFREERADPSAVSRDGRSRPARVPRCRTAYGGAGLNYVSYGLIAREIERVDSGYRSMMSVQILAGHAARSIEFGSERAEAQVPAAAGAGREDRLLRSDRARSRLRSGEHDHAGARGPRWLSAVGVEDLDLEQPDSPMCSSFGRRPTTMSSGDSSSRRAGRACRRR